MPDLVIFLIALALLLITALLANALFRHDSRPAHLCALFILAYAEIVLIGEITSLFHVISATSYLAAHLVFAAMAWYLWRRAGRPALLGPFSGGRWRFWRELAPFKAAPALYILAIGVGLAYLLGAYLILAFPQHNYDSMTYHLSRVGYWQQHHTMAPWPTPNPRQTISPINAELGLLWTTLLWGRDQLTGFVQWFSALAILVSIYGLTRLLGATRPQAFFAALVWATFPQVLLQSITTQNDLVVAAFISCTVYFFYRGLYQENKGQLLLSGLALGLALGTKSTALIFMPGLALVVLVSAWHRQKVGTSLVIAWILAATLGFGMLGVFIYLQNLLNYGDPFNVPGGAAHFAGPQVSRWALLVGNTFLYLYQFFDPAGLPDKLGHALIQVKATLANVTIAALKLPISPLPPGSPHPLAKALYPLLVIHPDTTWFGPLSALLLIPASLYYFWQSLRRRLDLRLGLILICAGFVVSLSLMMGWTPYRGRYLVPFVSLLAPLLAFWYRPSRLNKVLQWAIAVSAVWIMGWTLLYNISLPLIGVNAVWHLSPDDVRALSHPKIKPVLEMVDRHVPAQAMLATRLGLNDWDYPLFGPRFERKIIQADPTIKGLDLDAFREENAGYLLISPRERPFLEVPKGLEFLDETDSWTLYKISAETIPDETPAEIQAKLLGMTDPKNLLAVDPRLSGIVGVIEIEEFDWSIESNQGTGFLWLGEGFTQGLAGYLWSEKEITVRAVMRVMPGPSREDMLRNLEFRFFRQGTYSAIKEGSVIQRFQITELETIEATFTLQRGINQIGLIALDEATIPRLPNGDERPLLVMLQHVDILPVE